MPEQPIDRVLRAFPHAKKQPNGWYEDRCPAHEDHHASFGFREAEDGHVWMKCQRGCPQGEILKRVGLTLRDLYPTLGSNGERHDEHLTTYDYVDTKGHKLLFQVVRAPGKRFFQRRPDGMGGWIKDMKGAKRVLYRLPEVLAARETGSTVYLAEGEKDVDRLRSLGLTATTNPGGAGKWQDTYSLSLSGCEVVILPDNDEPGEQHADLVAAALRGKAASVRVVKLPGLPAKGDVSDWLDEGHTREELEELAAFAEPAVSAPAAASFTYDDLGNAKRLIARHGADIRYCSVWERWLVWDGRRWEPDENSAIRRHAIETAESIPDEVKGVSDPEAYRKALRHAESSRNASSLSAMVRVAEAFGEVAVTPSYFDRDPWLLNCLNGTVDLRTGELRPHTREDYITKLAPVDYKPGASHPLWNDLIEKVTGGVSEVRSYLQRAAGYSLTGSTQEEKVFVLVSDGGGGKTTFLEAMAGAMGDYATAAEQGTFMARSASGGGHSEDVAALVGARLVLATEVGKGRLADELLKRMTGGDTMRASRKHGHSFTFRPCFTLWLAANMAPSADDQDSGVWRRLRRIPWTPIPPEQRDPAAKEVLRRPDQCGAAVLAWMVEGCLAWREEGLGDAPAIVEATERYRQELDPFTEFVSQMCVLGEWQWVQAGELRKAYEGWCRDSGYKPISGKAWGDRLRAYGFKDGNARPHGRIWNGIGLRGDAENGEDEGAATDNLLHSINTSSLFLVREKPKNDVASCCSVAEPVSGEQEDTETVNPDGSFFDE